MNGGAVMDRAGLGARIGRLLAVLAPDSTGEALLKAPDAVLARALGEMAAGEGLLRHELGRLRAEQHRLGRRLGELGNQQAELDRRIRDSVSAGALDRARADIGRQISLGTEITALQQAAATADDDAVQLEATIRQMKARRRDAETRLATLRRPDHDQPEGENGPGVAPPGPAAPDNPADLAALEALVRDHQIEERLARLIAEREPS